MAMKINDEYIPDALIEEEFERTYRIHAAQKPEIQSDSATLDHLRLSAACAVVDKILLLQFAELDTSPLDPGEVEAEIARQIEQNHLRININERGLRRSAVETLRLRRAYQQIAGEVEPPTRKRFSPSTKEWKPRLRANP